MSESLKEIVIKVSEEDMETFTTLLTVLKDYVNDENNNIVGFTFSALVLRKDTNEVLETRISSALPSFIGAIRDLTYRAYKNSYKGVK